jgi:DNA-binding IclR family transcriptional regulator
MAEGKTILYSALEHYLLNTMRNLARQCVTIAELAQATALPRGTVRMGVQWLLACGDLKWLGEEECYQLAIST